MIHYREHRASAPLRRAIECVWTLEVDADSAHGEPQRIVPDGCVEWIVHLGDAVHERVAASSLSEGAEASSVPARCEATSPPARGDAPSTRVQPARFVVGPRDRAIVIEPSGRLACLGIRFRPAGARAFLRAPQSELYDRSVPADDIARELDRALASRLDPDDPPERWVAHAEAVLGEIDASCPDPLAVAASDAIVAAHGRISIDALALSLGVSRRTLERRFDREVGLSPKRLARIARFQRVFHWTRDGAVDWAAVALACGYSDQAHLIRDFRELAGETPAALVAAERELTDTFTRRDRVSHSSNRGA